MAVYLLLLVVQFSKNFYYRIGNRILCYHLILFPSSVFYKQINLFCFACFSVPLGATSNNISRLKQYYNKKKITVLNHVASISN